MAYGDWRLRTDAAAVPVDEGAIFHSACTSALVRCGILQKEDAQSVQGVSVGDGPTSWPVMQYSFSAFMHAFSRVEAGLVPRMLVAGLLQPCGGVRSSKPALRGAFAVLIESEAALAVRSPTFDGLKLVEVIQARAGERDSDRMLQVLREHGRAPLYGGMDDPLIPALSILPIANRPALVDTKDSLPQSPQCRCLVQMVSEFEDHWHGSTLREGVIFASESVAVDAPAGIFVVAPAHRSSIKLND